ncbi:TraI/MobA(P) family conjugative relaxase [Klebsiella pneumoniae]|uniref:TraI/MobA(P) family conjugative relaxase n=1 Tax=Klebsiella pneumoniae TaxID=573 RepID=UPI002A548D5C|nr:relaxase/mobilization nuclease domain-containing protein [Klebsiella pneumoniae]HEK7856293.1 relaxase/mobilization nuclease domain-containing protein [Klebsiella pneumoniae]HEK7915625.1 relaxase/mobilization nuclease domain-containing protein [Klebsiella pneumoniae]HEK7978882.1 relaxase/mobilization nuclease domain-containing protein [Klebsiella pneumoniae]HEK7994221.1 relaxase/mobilization nuclease domain-containing protein [Klebsiella pneumoniae]
MIAKVPDGRRDGRSSFLQLITYNCIRDELSPEEALREDARFRRPSRSREACFERLVGYIDRSQNAGEGEGTEVMLENGDFRIVVNGVVIQHNCFSLETAPVEMAATAMANRRCEEPVFHYILSWQEDENPDPDIIFSCVADTQKALGLEGHQYVAAIHRDTDNVHVHIATNRICPRTFKAATLSFSKERLQRCCRQLELKHGFRHDNGSWKVDEQGHVVRAKKRIKALPEGAARLEHFADTESLTTYARQHCFEQIDRLLSGPHFSWGAAHEILCAAGLCLDRKGEGLAVYSLYDTAQTPIRASRLHPDLTLKQEAIAGSFQSPDWYPDSHNQYRNTLHVRDQGARAERREARANARLELRARYERYRMDWKKPDLDVEGRFRAIAAEARDRKAEVRRRGRTVDPQIRRLAYNIIAFERMQKEAALRLQLREERATLHAAGKLRPMTYRGWVEQEAVKGDVAAISQLRGWHYRSKRKQSRADGIVYCGPADDLPPLYPEGYDTRVRRDGVICYSRGGKPAVLDYGDRIEVANTRHAEDVYVAVASTAWRSREKVEFSVGKGFSDEAARQAARYNYWFPNEPVKVTDTIQANKVRREEVYISKSGSTPVPDSSDRTEQRHISSTKVRPH